MRILWRTGALDHVLKQQFFNSSVMVRSFAYGEHADLTSASLVKKNESLKF